jgi:DNA-binding NarL/FixJ family response regulator
MKILLIDDNELIRVRLARAIKKQDESINIFNAINCKEALASFSQINFDIVILDISLPDGSGIDLLRTMKKEKPQVTIFMLTHYSTSEFKKSCLELGADCFFDKSQINGLIDSIGLQHKTLDKFNELQLRRNEINMI